VNARQQIIGDVSISLTQGTVLLSPQFSFGDEGCSCWEFEAEVCMLYLMRASVRKGFQAMVYVASTMQTACIEEIRKKVSCMGYSVPSGDMFRPAQWAHHKFCR